MFANIILIILNLFVLLVGLLVGEYEVSKLLKPQASWLATPAVFDLFASGFLVVLAVGNLGVLLFVVLRHLDHHRRWLWWSSSIGILGVFILGIVLANRFLSILLPNL